MRALLLAAVVGGCLTNTGSYPDGATLTECFPQFSSICHVVIDVPQLDVSIDWICTSGYGDADMGRPEQRTCVLCPREQPMWCEAGNGACVHDCAECTPEIVYRLNPWAKCVPVDDTPAWYPRDMTL